MTRNGTRLFVVGLITLVVGQQFAEAAPPGSGWRLQFADEFAGDTVDSLKWQTKYPWGRTHNHDAYMRDQNVVLGDGTASLIATRENFGGKPFTSGAISTGYNKYTFTGGYVEARILLPNTTGSWPAFWGLYTGWPPEADIMEYPIGAYNQDEYHTAFHYSTGGGGNASGAGKVNPGSAGDLGNSYHLFGMDWKEDDYVRGTGEVILNGDGYYQRRTDVIDGATLTVNGKLYQGVVLEEALVQVDSGSTISLNNLNDNGGSLGNLKGASDKIVIDNGTLEVRGQTSTRRGLMVGAGGATLQAANGANVVFRQSADKQFLNTSGANLNLNGAGKGAIYKQLSGAGNLTKLGTGNWILGAANNYSGNTNVQAGTLTVNGTSGTGTTDVAAGATLGGNGTILGNVNSAGNVAPGQLGNPTVINPETAGKLAFNFAGVQDNGPVTATSSLPTELTVVQGFDFGPGVVARHPGGGSSNASFIKITFTTSQRSTGVEVSPSPTTFRHSAIITRKDYERTFSNIQLLKLIKNLSNAVVKIRNHACISRLRMCFGAVVIANKRFFFIFLQKWFFPLLGHIQICMRLLEREV